MESSVQLETLNVKEAASQIQEAAAAKKCWPCGCLHSSLSAIERAFPEGKRPAELDEAIQAARARLSGVKYDCLGCEVCFPANAVNALKVEGDACPAEAVQERQGWPPLPGDYTVVRYGAPVAVCALNSAPLAKQLAERRPEGLAIVGTLRTENLGIERVIKNTLANPHIRFLLLCGEDTQQAVGHLPGQSFESLLRSGIDERGRIVGAQGKRPVLKNVSGEEVQAFRQQVELAPMIGEENVDNVSGAVLSCAERNPGAYPYPFKDTPVSRIQVAGPKPLTLDKAGYFVVYPDHRAKRLVVEHYTNQGVLNCVLEASSTGALYGEAIERQLLTRLDHAAYLGQELARAERSLLDGTPFAQDAAPGELAAPAPETDCSSGSTCGCSPAPQTPPQTKRMVLMKMKWIGLIAVVLVAGAIIGYKAYVSPPHAASSAAVPRVLLVADMSEADSADDSCAEIIHLVQAARGRGIAVQELSPGSKSDLLVRYHVLTIPTVLILDRNRQVVSRYEGEGRDTVKAVRAGLEQLQ